MNITYVGIDELKEGPWRATHVLKPDMALLAQSINAYGWTAPLVVRHQTMEIIDGHHRWLVVLNDKGLARRVKKQVPVLTVRCSKQQAMLMHLQLNRSRGSVTGEGMSRVVRELVLSKAFSKHDLMHSLAMSQDELDVMVDGTLFKHRNVANHQYSKAWVPIEAPSSITHDAAIIERPPNADR